MADRITCPKCGISFYADDGNVSGPCFSCGFVFHWRMPDRRLSKRTQTKEFITLGLHNQILSKANVVNTSAKGVGVIFSNHSGVKKGDTIIYSFGKRGKRGKAKVVWHDNTKGNERAGLLLN